jgi:septin family protein
MRHLFLTHLLCLIALTALAATGTYADTKLESELLARITKAQNELAAAEKKISQERRTLAGVLDRKQQEVKQLRTEAAASQRLADEQLLGLDKLQQRVDQWTSK